VAFCAGNRNCADDPTGSGALFTTLCFPAEPDQKFQAGLPPRYEDRRQGGGCPPDSGGSSRVGLLRGVGEGGSRLCLWPVCRRREWHLVVAGAYVMDLHEAFGVFADSSESHVLCAWETRLVVMPDTTAS
jgi:hypothetical protein